MALISKIVGAGICEEQSLIFVRDMASTDGLHDSLLPRMRARSVAASECYGESIPQSWPSCATSFSSDQGPYTCQRCGATFAKKDSFLRHVGGGNCPGFVPAS
ncbi:uncharacterized protein B0H18DRAFT_983814 [Fomitopsis serialis]|uniref:uncharacterized protein n=1 Tax=Fomitopsis serialis TaxID=139415 RepID=UPI002007B759|nr:uncharacterized protein B0H18DRAFT_983814 [Neoantrodia serialis]KAH9933459.1 hypothetical protein B0H18DRAFT_983814 [Neoantrodia serialis]